VRNKLLIKADSYYLPEPEAARALQGTDASVTAGQFSRLNRDITVTSESFVTTVEEVASLVVGVHQGRPVYLRDIAEVKDGPEEATHYSRIGYSHRLRKEKGREDLPLTYPAVTLALAKKRGTNAVWVAERILEKLETHKKTVIPDHVAVEVTRNYGETAQQKVSELLKSLSFAILTVVGLLALTLGWREALVVALAVPISFSLALFMNYLLGYTINRVTLFALILSLGLVVDDPITNVDNIQRHILMGKRKPRAATLFAVNEVLPPVIMSTLAIIVSFAPLFFITGMMGPYMAPMAANVPLTVTFSTFCALTCVPWLSYLLLHC
jgi:multidrug efflux pump subunit AcrB